MKMFIRPNIKIQINNNVEQSKVDGIKKQMRTLEEGTKNGLRMKCTIAYIELSETRLLQRHCRISKKCNNCNIYRPSPSRRIPFNSVLLKLKSCKI